VNFVSITICVASQRVFIFVFISLSTQSGNFWIYPSGSNAQRGTGFDFGRVNGYHDTDFTW
jgi:hypothetical protein